MPEMEPGDRFSLIRSIHSTLMRSDHWDGPLIDTVLSEFGAEYSHVESVTERILERLRSLDDNALVQLNQHVNPDAVSPAGVHDTGSDADGPWSDGAVRLFISHTSAHREAAGDIRDWMSPLGVDAFVAHDSIEPTRAWQDVIESALATCHALAALLTADFKQSNWCDQEVGFAVGRGILIIPVKIGIDPYGFVGRVQALTMHEGDRRTRRVETADGLFSLLAGNPLTLARMVDPVLKRFMQSRSFAAARAAWPDVERLPVGAWTTSRLQRVREAVRANSQLAKGALDDGTGRWFPQILEEHLESRGVG